MDENNPHFTSEEAVDFYTQRLAHLGPSAYAQGWFGRASQRKRFAALAEVGDLRDASVLDVGCGLADFYAYLKERGIEARYTGIDFTPGMLAEAERRYPHLRFLALDVTDAEAEPGEQADYVVVSGLFSHLDAERFRQVVPRLFAWSRKATAFNSLNAQGAEQEPNAFHCDPDETLGFCRTLTPYLHLRQDYLPNDFTVYLYHEPHTPEPEPPKT